MTRLTPEWPPKKRPFGRIQLVDGIRGVKDKPFDWSRRRFGFSTEPSEGKSQPWVRVDLGSRLAFSEVRLYPRNDEGHEGYGFPLAYRVEVSDDAENWSELINVRDIKATAEPQIHSFDPVEARYLRVVGTELPQRPDDRYYIMQITELEVYK
jgi:hypothetical protein